MACAPSWSRVTGGCRPQSDGGSTVVERDSCAGSADADERVR